MEIKAGYGDMEYKAYICQPPEGCGFFLFWIQRERADAPWQIIYNELILTSATGICPKCGRPWVFESATAERIVKCAGILAVDSEPEGE